MKDLWKETIISFGHMNAIYYNYYYFFTNVYFNKKTTTLWNHSGRAFTCLFHYFLLLQSFSTFFMFEHAFYLNNGLDVSILIRMCLSFINIFILFWKFNKLHGIMQKRINCFIKLSIYILILLLILSSKIGRVIFLYV